MIQNTTVLGKSGPRQTFVAFVEGSLQQAVTAVNDIHMSYLGMDPKLYALQEVVLAALQGLNDRQFANAKLCGGTALARFWLDHRVSYDLDFFLPEGFDALALSVSLKNGGVEFEVTDVVDDKHKANQLHGFVVHKGERLKVSFIEDAYFDVYPVTVEKLGGLAVRTESVEGLYHRKLRTVCGRLNEGSEVVGGRQTARDLFDLYVLSRACKPIREFIATLPCAFPSDAFDNGLSGMPWLDLAEELHQIRCAPAWEEAKDMARLQDALYAEIGAMALDEFPNQDDTSGDTSGDTGGDTGEPDPKTFRSRPGSSA